MVVIVSYGAQDSRPAPSTFPVARRTSVHADTPIRVAYLSLQAVVEGQDSWAAVTETIKGFESRGWRVDRYFARYTAERPSAAERAREMRRVQRSLADRLSEYDAVYVRAHPFAGRLARAAAREGTPVVQECNGSYEDLFIAWPFARVLRWPIESAQRWQYSHADSVVTVTPELADWIGRETGRSDAVVSPNGAADDVFRPDAAKRPGLPERYAVFFGQLAPWQGTEVLIDALASPVWPTGLPLVVVGDGVLRPRVEAAATSDSHVVYLGRLPYAEVAGVVAGAAVSLIPLFDDVRGATGYSPLKLYESMACGVPVVISAYAGLAQVIAEERCGIAVPPGDASALAGAVAELVGDSERARELGLNGRRAVESRYSWTARGEQRAAVVEAAIRRARSSL